MRMLKVAMVLLVLASFVAASVAVSMAAMGTPTLKKPMATMPATPTLKAAMPNATMKAPVMPNTTMGKPTMPSATIKMPGRTVAKPGMLISLDQMKSDIGGVYQNLKKSVKMPGAVVSGPALGVKSKASQMISGTSSKMTSGQGQSLLRGVPAPQAISKMSGMPQLGNMVKIV